MKFCCKTAGNLLDDETGLTTSQAHMSKAHSELVHYG